MTDATQPTGIPNPDPDQWSAVDFAIATNSNLTDCVELYNLMDDSEWREYCRSWYRRMQDKDEQT